MNLVIIVPLTPRGYSFSVSDIKNSSRTGKQVNRKMNNPNLNIFPAVCYLIGACKMKSSATANILAMKANASTCHHLCRTCATSDVSPRQFITVGSFEEL